MRPEPLHGWSLSVREAIDLQSRIAGGVVREDRLGEVRLVAGVDVAYDRRGRSGIARAAVVVLSFPDLSVVEQAAVEVAVEFPYVPGLLTFREAPAAIAALERLSARPDVLLCDGQGLAHPRRLGFAAHLGLFLDAPSVGVAKSVLIGTYEEPGPAKGDWSPLMDKGEVIGAALRTRAGVRPIYVSIGHRVSLPTAISLVLACTTSFRLPQTTRAADRLSKTRLA
ncbi:MAG TPA: deoxyribonuclease V [Rhodospirillales bacterium]|jgi:deoxyribonuclease V|nr:deoxyribonuclease V [Rhodospirillales bacterium]